MTREDILTLAKAGFNAQQIAALNSVQAAPQQAAEPAAQPAQEEKPTQSDNMAKLMEQLTGIKADIKAANLAGASQPQPETADSILAAIINPPQKEG